MMTSVVPAPWMRLLQLWAGTTWTRRERGMAPFVVTTWRRGRRRGTLTIAPSCASLRAVRSRAAANVAIALTSARLMSGGHDHQGAQCSTRCRARARWLLGPTPRTGDYGELRGIAETQGMPTAPPQKHMRFFSSGDLKNSYLGMKPFCNRLRSRSITCRLQELVSAAAESAHGQRTEEPACFSPFARAN